MTTTFDFAAGPGIRTIGGTRTRSVPESVARSRNTRRGEGSRIAADLHAEDLRATIERLKRDGHQSLHALARALNLAGVRSRRGGEWHASSVRNLLKRLELLETRLPFLAS